MSSDGRVQNQDFTYVITETGPWTSLDPLQGDNTQNLPVQRMIYATPFEISQDNQLVSGLLSSYSYDVESKTMTWSMKSGLSFDDGSPLTVEDVAFAISRMAYARPQFPVVSSLEGLDEWLRLKSPLESYPRGLKVQDDQITMVFKKDVRAPFFRFSLELFSVIPKNCVDLKTNQLNCSQPPASGHYRILGHEANKVIFEKRGESRIFGRRVPQVLTVKYRQANQVLTDSLLEDPGVIIAGVESMYSEKALKDLQVSHSLRFTPAARFLTLLLSPKVPPFEQVGCRRAFAQAFRRAFQVHRFGREGVAEASIFTKILPGYKSLQQLEASSVVEVKDDQICRGFSGGQNKLLWAYVKGELPTQYAESLEAAARELGLELATPQVVRNRRELGELFAQGLTSVIPASSGFWALDPVGDVKMLFTPNLHRALTDLSGDAMLQKLINSIEEDSEGFNRVNQYLFDQANFNVYAHIRRFYLAGQGGQMEEPPFAIVLPAPWQVFKLAP